MANCYRSQELSLLEKLPAELLLEIQQYLPIERRPLFPILSPRILEKIGYYPNALSTRERNALLRQMEQYDMYPELILCRFCYKFHRPELSLALDSDEWTRLRCQGEGAHLHIRTPYFEEHAHKTVVAGLIRQQSLRHLLLSVPISSNVQSMVRVEKKVEEIQMDSLRDLKVVGGRCLLKMQDIFYFEPQLAKATYHENPPGHFRLGTLLSGTCPHLHPNEMIQEVFLPSGWRDQAEVSLDKILDCLWNHEKPCQKHCLPSLNWIRSCHTCPIDYSISAMDAPFAFEGKRVRAVILTSWRDLGDGKFKYTGSNDDRYQEHLERLCRGRKSRKCGDIFQAYEQTSQMSFAPDYPKDRITLDTDDSTTIFTPSRVEPRAD